MGGLTRLRSVGAVEDVLVARDAETGFLTIEGIVASVDESAAIEEFVAFFRQATKVGDRADAERPIGHVILEKLVEAVDPATAGPLDREKMMELLAPLRTADPPDPPPRRGAPGPRPRRVTPAPQSPRSPDG